MLECTILVGKDYQLETKQVRKIQIFFLHNNFILEKTFTVHMMRFITMHVCHIWTILYSFSPQVVWRKLGNVVPGFRPDLS